MKTSAQTIIDSLDHNPEGWTANHHRLMHHSGLHLWICGPVFDLHIMEPTKQSFGLIDKFRVASAVKRWKDWNTRKLIDPKIKPTTGAFEL